MPKKPPTHRIGQPMRIIDLDAFDTERVLSDFEPLEEDDDRRNEHPVLAYRQGTSRFDIDAPRAVYTENEDGELEPTSISARDYLKGSEHESEHAVFECKRLTTMEVSTCLQRGDEIGPVWAFHLACKAVLNVPGLEFHVGRRKQATDAQIEAVHDAMGYDVIPRIGRMILAGSRAPTSAEGKRSGSSHGAT